MNRENKKLTMPEREKNLQKGLSKLAEQQDEITISTQRIAEYIDMEKTKSEVGTVLLCMRQRLSMAGALTPIEANTLDAVISQYLPEAYQGFLPQEETPDKLAEDTPEGGVSVTDTPEPPVIEPPVKKLNVQPKPIQQKSTQEPPNQRAPSPIELRRGSLLKKIKDALIVPKEQRKLKKVEKTMQDDEYVPIT